MKHAAVTLNVAVAGLLFAVIADAHPLSQQECSEGSDFIKNAALARDNGMDRMTFESRVLADLAAIKSFPAELRWFVQDEEDEEYLTRAVADVFDNPVDPQVHQRNFLRHCLTRTAAG